MDSTAEIKSRLDIADLIGEYLQIKPAGSGSFKALCPFHGEKTPSFYISRNRQTWHCFGCSEGGDIFTFVQKIEGMDFRESLEFLANKVGYQLPTFSIQSVESSSLKKRIHEINDLAMRFFRSALANLPQAEVAREYLKRRGLDDLTSDLFQLGYAPDSWSSLSEALIKKGVSAEEMVKAGLAIKKEQGGGIFDRFRHRAMFPIADIHGNLVGFTGRILTDDKKEAKYMNTPETVVYKKSAILYGLEKAKGEIRRLDQAVIVEGNMDVIASHQFSINNVVAASGTALTQEQLALLKRFTSHLSIAFDQDAAGQNATLRGLDLARSQDFSIKIITLPPEAGKDPDEAVRKDPNIWKQAIENAIGIMEWVYRQGFQNRHPERPEDKKLIAQDILPEVARIVDPIEKDHWLRRLAKDLDVSELALREALSRHAKATQAFSYQPKKEAEQSQKEVKKETYSPEQHLLAVLVSRPESLKAAIETHHLETGEWSDPQLGALYGQLILAYNPAGIAQKGSLLTLLRPPDSLDPTAMQTFDAIAFLAERDYRDLSLDECLRELQTHVSVLRTTRRQLERRRLEEEMRQAERTGDTQKIADIMKRFQELA